MLPVDFVCNDAFLPLEGAVSPATGKETPAFEQAVKVACTVYSDMQVWACTEVFILCNIDIFAKPYITN